jgi:branched-chain amino acid transport system ATP-binding protein
MDGSARTPDPTLETCREVGVSAGALLEVSGIGRSFGQLAVLSDVTFKLSERHSMALIGPNGAGKSTCFNIIGGQLRPSTGAVRFQGSEIAGLPAHHAARYAIGRTFQTAEIFGSMTVVENVQMALLAQAGRHRSLTPRMDALCREGAMAVLERVGLAESADQLCDTLAYGDVKRMEFATALARKPKLLLMDEPTAGMAVKERFALMDLVARIVDEEGLSILFTEHDVDVVFNYAETIIVLNRGKIVLIGAPSEVRADAEVRRIYLGEQGALEAHR